jgi:hypothetical protein
VAQSKAMHGHLPKAKTKKMAIRLQLNSEL